MSHDVFICYANKDKPVADEIVSYLENKGIQCWIAPRNIPPGSQWANAIVSAIENSLFMVVIISGNSDSPHLMREVDEAVSNELTLIPFRIEDISPPGALTYLLNHAQWLDAFEPPLEQHLNKLSDIILVSHRNEAPDMIVSAIIDDDDLEFVKSSDNQKGEEIHEESHQKVEQDDPWKLFTSNLPISQSKKSEEQDQRETLLQLRRIIGLSADTLQSNPRELASQLKGRLSSSVNSGVLDLLASLEHKVEHPWFRPRGTCLPGLETPILASWSILDDVPACRLLISDNSAVVCAISRDRNWFWEIGTGVPLADIEAYPLFTNVDWDLWRKNLPDQQFADSEGKFKWVAITPPGPISVSCSLERTGGSAFNRSYENLVTLDNHGVVKELSKSYKSEVFASEGFLASSVSNTHNKIVCGGLNGLISIWDLPSGSLESTLSVGNRTIVAISGFPDFKRCAALTLDGQLLIIEMIESTKQREKELAPPIDLYLSKDHPIAVVTHIDGSVSVWFTVTDHFVLRKPGWNAGSPFAKFRLTPDLSVAIITGHGEDNYDGWLLNGLNLASGEELFAYETRMSNDMFGALTLENHDNHLYLRIDPIDKKSAPSGASSSFTDVVLWTSLTSGLNTKQVPPSKNGEQINWVSSSNLIGNKDEAGFSPWFTDQSTDQNKGFDEIYLSSDLRTIIAGRTNLQRAQFTLDGDILLLGISPYDDTVVCVTSSGLYVMDLVGTS